MSKKPSNIKLCQGRSLTLTSYKKGMTMPLVVVFGAVFLTLLGGLFGFILTQHRSSLRKAALESSFEIAEAGMNYYRWCLNHDLAENCLGEKDYFDANANLIGKFNLEATSTASCGKIIQREIMSSGWTNQFSDLKRKINALYSRTSIAKYSYSFNCNGWIGV